MRGSELHYATQESVDNVKECLSRFEHQTEKQFEAVHESINELRADTKKRIDELKTGSDKRFDQLETRIDRLLMFLLIGSFVAGFTVLYIK